MDSALKEHCDRLQAQLMEIKTRLASSGARLAVACYNGSGDSGCVDSVTFHADEGQMSECPRVEGREELENLCEDYIIGKLSPNYNDDGCSGEMRFLITEDGTLSVTGDHYDYYTSSDHTAVEELV